MLSNARNEEMGHILYVFIEFYRKPKTACQICITSSLEYLFPTFVSIHPGLVYTCKYTWD